MQRVINSQNIYFEKEGSGVPLLLLHGWGVDSSSFASLRLWMREYFTVYTLDFCGFGKSPVPNAVWGVKDYADMVEYFIEAEKIDNPIILGHSFGGRVALYLGARGIGRKLLLVDAAGVKPKRTMTYYLRVYSYKAAKMFFSLPVLKKYREEALNFWRKNTPSTDYKQASGVMRSIFVKVVNEDLCFLMPKITVPTLMIWGENDTSTPVSDAQIMERKIKGSGVAIIPNAGHFCFLDQRKYFRLIVESFLQEEMK